VALRHHLLGTADKICESTHWGQQINRSRSESRKSLVWSWDASYSASMLMKRIRARMERSNVKMWASAVGPDAVLTVAVCTDCLSSWTPVHVLIWWRRPLAEPGICRNVHSSPPPPQLVPVQTTPTWYTKHCYFYAWFNHAVTQVSVAIT
jgi:hypothetical protein